MRRRGLLLSLMGLAWGLALWPGPALAGPAAAPPAEEIARFTALGGEYSAEGFKEFPPGLTPFQRWRRVDTSRLKGREVYVSVEGVRIWKEVFCGKSSTIYIELTLMDRSGQKIPFGWQYCGLVCCDGGSCSPANAIFLDLSGDGRPDLKLPKLGDLITIERPWFKNPRYSFTKDILPAWVRKIVGAKLEKVSTVGPGDSVGHWKDHPLTIDSCDQH